MPPIRRSEIDLWLQAFAVFSMSGSFQVTFFSTPFIRPIFPELRGAVRQHAFGWPALFPFRYLWCREPALLRGRAVHQRCGEPRKRPHCLMCLGYGGDQIFKITNALFRERWTRSYELQRTGTYRRGWHHVKAKSCH